jgi:hypothetical protein
MPVQKMTIPLHPVAGCCKKTLLSAEEEQIPPQNELPDGSRCCHGGLLKAHDARLI